MAKKCLILYASRTGNTEQVAMVFKHTFEQHGWKCDLCKVDQKTDVTQIPFDYNDYDFMCLGSPVYVSLALPEVIKALRKTPAEQTGVRGGFHQRIIFGPESKKGVVFVTFSGAHLGPKESEAALAWMALEMEHMRFHCLGRFSCPGKSPNIGDRPTPELYYADIKDRPNERDLKAAEIFIEQILEEIREKA